jgi:hypothetical protein
MPNMKTKGQRNLKLLGGQEKTDGRPDGRTDGRTSWFQYTPPYNFVVRGYKNPSLHVRLSKPRFCQAVTAEQDIPYRFLGLNVERRFFLMAFFLHVLWPNSLYFLLCCPGGEGDAFSGPSISLRVDTNAVCKTDLKYSKTARNIYIIHLIKKVYVTEIF